VAHWGLGKSKVKIQIYEDQNGKCCYCENTRNISYETDVEHFRPKLNKDTSENDKFLGYWWLAYEWSNLLLSCNICNRKYKKNQFPLLNENCRAITPNDNLGQEESFLIDPLKEDPKDFIGFDWENKSVIALGKDRENRGSKTCNELTGINDPFTILDRSDLLVQLHQMAFSYEYFRQENNQTEKIRWEKKIKETTSSKIKYAGFRRSYFRHRDLADIISDD